MTKLFVDIEKLYTFKSAAKKLGVGVSEKDLSLIRDAAILTEKGKITWIGKRSNAPRSWNIKKISLNAKVVMPAFVDCHTHMVFAGDRSNEFELRNKGASYQEIAEKGGGILSTVKATRKVSAERLLELAREREKAYLSQGVATIEVKSGYGLNLATEKKILGVARSLKKLRVVTTFLGAHAVPKGKSSAEYFNEVLKWLPKFVGFADRVDIFVEQGYFGLDQAQKLFEASRKLGFQLCGHTDQLTSTGSSLQLANWGGKKCGSLRLHH